MAGSILANRAEDIPTDSGVAVGISSAFAFSDPRIKAKAVNNTIVGLLKNDMNVLLSDGSCQRSSGGQQRCVGTTALLAEAYLAAASSVT
jgi:hypothetical protein